MGTKMVLCTELGVSPARCLTIDILHRAHQSAMRAACRIALWHLLLGGIYHAIGAAGEAA